MNKNHRYSDTDTTEGKLLFLLFTIALSLLMGGLMYLITGCIAG
jgi:hypothetical protein